MFCSECGNTVGDSSAFCVNCGCSINNTDAAVNYGVQGNFIPAPKKKKKKKFIIPMVLLLVIAGVFAYDYMGDNTIISTVKEKLGLESISSDSNTAKTIQDLNETPAIDFSKDTLNITYNSKGDVCLTFMNYRLQNFADIREEYSDDVDTVKSMIWTEIVDSIVYGDVDENKLDVFVEKINDSILTAANSYNMSFDEFVETAGMSSDAYEDYVAESALLEYAMVEMVLFIYETEELTLSQDEIDELVLELVLTAGLSDVAEANEAGYTDDDLELNVITETVITWLYENCLYDL